MKLEKFFTSDEISFLKQYAQQHQLKEDEAVISLAREMIGTYSMKFVNGQTVLSMLDLLATKMPIWMNLQLGALKQSYLSVRSTAQSIKNLEHPTLWEEIISLLKDPQLSSQAQSFITGITSALQGFVAPGSKAQEQEKSDEGDDEFI
jgi:hypothetical protein